MLCRLSSTITKPQSTEMRFFDSFKPLLGQRHLIRCFGTAAKSNVRVRFAPSPTGFMHLGGLRTALYNYLFARVNNGTFIVRIEDTDRTRVVPSAQEKIFECLEWAGISPDESVVHGGNHGPYVQSDRLHLYQNHVEQLIASGDAYHCFCTERRLELLRRDAIRANLLPKYDNRCRHLSAEKVKEKVAKKHPHVIRLKLGDITLTTIEDLVFGTKNVDLASEGDPIIMKTDGFPTYHLANVVDDHLMEITHVLRGAEWLVSTPKHISLYRAFGWTPPKYAHLPLIFDSGGSKLSKRDDHARVEYYRNQGIFPQGLINYITTNGGGFNWTSSAEVKGRSMKELIESFDLGKIQTNASRLQADEIVNCNRLEIQRQINDPTLFKDFVPLVQEFLKRSMSDNHESLELDDTNVRNVLQYAHDSLPNLQVLIEGDPSFAWTMPPLPDNYIQPDWLCKMVDALQHVEFQRLILGKWMREFAKSEGVGFTKMMKTLRMLLSGKKDGYQIPEMMQILGRNGTCKRLLRTNDARREKIVQNN